MRTAGMHGDLMQWWLYCWQILSRTRVTDPGFGLITLVAQLCSQTATVKLLPIMLCGTWGYHEGASETFLQCELAVFWPCHWTH